MEFLRKNYALNWRNVDKHTAYVMTQLQLINSQGRVVIGHLARSSVGVKAICGVMTRASGAIVCVLFTTNHE